MREDEEQDGVPMSLPERDPQTMLELDLIRPELEDARKAVFKAYAYSRVYATTKGAREFVLDWLNVVMDPGNDLQDDFLSEAEA